MKMYIGLDVHSKYTKFVAQAHSGQVIDRGEVATSLAGFKQMVEKVGAPPETKVGLETGQQSTWVSRILASLEMKVIVVDAREVRAKARKKKQKTDKRDAFDICEGIRKGYYECIIYVPEPEIERLRRICSRRRHFTKVCTKQINAAKYLLRSIGLGGEAKALTTWAAWEKLLQKEAMKSLKRQLKMHAELWKVSKGFVDELTKELEEAMEPFKETEGRLRTLYGVGPITAATYIAAIGTPERFPTSGHVASYIGLVPSTYDTGDKEKHGHITKTGSRELRAMLCEAAQTASRPRHPLNPYFRRVCARHGFKKAIVCVAHRMARILYQMWRNGEDFDVRKLNVACEVKIRTETIRYRIKKTNRR